MRDFAIWCGTNLANAFSNPNRYTQEELYDMGMSLIIFEAVGISLVLLLFAWGITYSLMDKRKLRRKA